MKLSLKARNFLSQRPTLVGAVLGYRFYEHPTRGDEAPLIAITPDGRVIPTDWWECPSMFEVAELHQERAGK